MLCRGLEFVNCVFGKTSHCKNALTCTEPFFAQVPPPSNLLTYVKVGQRCNFPLLTRFEERINNPFTTTGH